MVKFKFSVSNGHYEKGSIVELSLETAEVFEKLNFGSIEKEQKPRATKKQSK